MTDHQREVADLAARILAGILSGRMAADKSFDLGSVRPHHIQGSVNIAMGLLEDVRQRVPPEPPASRQPGP